MSIREAQTSPSPRGEETAGRPSPQGRPAIIPLRWRGHGVDICAVIRDGKVAFIARDIFEALGRDAGAFAEDPSHFGERPLRAHSTAVAWDRATIGEIFAVIEETPLVADLFRFLDEQLAEFSQWGIDAIATSAAPSTPRPLDEPTEPTHYSVAQTASILSRDPVVNTSQSELFAWLHTHGWITKTAGHWTPARELVLIGHLTVVDAKIRGRKELYPQVCITVAGIHALHQHHGGIADLTLTPTTQPVLED